jgi:hypothetical protein
MQKHIKDNTAAGLCINTYSTTLLLDYVSARLSYSFFVSTATRVLTNYYIFRTAVRSGTVEYATFP